DVLANRPLAEQRLHTIGRDEHHPGADRVAWMMKAARVAANDDLAGLGPSHAVQAVEQLYLALPFEGGDAQHLAEAKREGDSVQRPGLEVAHLDRDGSSRRRARRSGLGRDLVGDWTEHQLDDAFLAALRGL